MRSPVILLSILALLAVAVVTDLRAHRIPNWLSLFGFAAGLGLQTWFGGAGGILQAALGAGVGLLGFMPLYVLRAMGAGDVKLLMAIGSILGPEATIFAVVFSLLAGGLGAIGFVLWRAVHSAASTVVRGEIAQLGASISVAARVARRERIPFALPIAVGSLAAWWQQSDCTHIAACLGSSLT
jgi:prepilin peptidase CpaA